MNVRLTKSILPGGLLLILLCAFADPAFSQIYTASKDFSQTQGYRNWYYLDWTGTAYEQMTYGTNWWGYQSWHGNSSCYTGGIDSVLYASGGHPNTCGYAPSRAWVSPADGPVQITGNARKTNPGGGDGVKVEILKNGEVLWSRTIAYHDTVGYNFNLAQQVVEGDTIYFRIHQRGTPYYDGTYFNPTIAFNEQPVADAGADQSVYLGDTVLLDGSATDPDGDPIVSWNWQFESKPDGSTAQLSDPNGQNPTFVADATGNFILTLTVSDGTITSARDAVIIHVAENLPPVAVIEADTTSGEAPLTVTFDGSNSYDPEGRELVYQWLFGDGRTSSSPVASHTYDSVGDFAAKLTVIDDRNQNDVSALGVEVTSPAAPPEVAATADSVSGKVPLTVQFAANATDANGDELTYNWSFGDGGVSTAANPSHTYWDQGTFEIQLEVSDGTHTVSDFLTVVVEPAIELSTFSLFVKGTGNTQSTMGNVHLAANLTPMVPLSGELIRATVDGVELFAAPFSAFTVAADEDPGVYQFKAGNILVKLRTNSGYLEVISHKLELSAIEPDNGVEVQLTIGPYTAVQTIEAVEEPGRKLTYRR